jgi:hypothetical protein
MLRTLPVIMLLLTVGHSIVLAQDACEGLTPVPLVLGEQGAVTPGDANNVRADASAEAERIGVIPGGERFTVLYGPVCADGFVWWQVAYQGLTGWTVDGVDGQAFLVPVEDEPVEANADVTATIPPYQPTSTVIAVTNISQLSLLRRISCPETDSEIGRMANILAISPNNRFAAVQCTYDQERPYRLLAVDLETGVPAHELPAAANASWPLTFLDEDTLVWIDYRPDNRSEIPVHQWSLSSGEDEVAYILNIANFLSGYPYVVADNTRVAWLDSGENNVLTQVDIRTGAIVRQNILPSLDRISNGGVLLSPDGARIALLSLNGDEFGSGIAQTVDAESESMLAEWIVPFPLDGPEPASFAFSPSGNFLLGAGCMPSCADGGVYWWDVSNGQRVTRWELPEETVAVTGIRFGPQRDVALINSPAGVLIYNIETDALITTIEPFQDVRFSADGTLMVTISIGEAGTGELGVWVVP